MMDYENDFDNEEVEVIAIEDNDEVDSKKVKKPVQVMVNQSEYDSIKKLVGSGSVAGSMRELFLESHKFSYNKMPRVDRTFLTTAIKVQKGLSEVARKLNETEKEFDANKRGIRAFTLLGAIDGALESIFTSYSRQDLTDAEIDDATWEIKQKKIKSKSYVSSERRTKTIRIEFTEEEYELATKKAERMEKKLAPAIREFFISQGDFIINSVPIVPSKLIKHLDMIGNELYYVAGIIENNKEIDTPLDLDYINEEHLNEIFKVMLSMTMD